MRYQNSSFSSTKIGNKQTKEVNLLYEIISKACRMVDGNKIIILFQNKSKKSSNSFCFDSEIKTFCNQNKVHVLHSFYKINRLQMIAIFVLMLNCNFLMQQKIIYKHCKNYHATKIFLSTNI